MFMKYHLIMRRDWAVSRNIGWMVRKEQYMTDLASGIKYRDFRNKICE